MRLLTWMNYDLEEVTLYALSEKRGIDEEGVRVRLPTTIEALA